LWFGLRIVRDDWHELRGFQVILRALLKLLPLSLLVGGFWWAALHNFDAFYTNLFFALAGVLILPNAISMIISKNHHALHDGLVGSRVVNLRKSVFVPLDQDQIAEMIGKHILVGLTYVDQQDGPVEYKQLRGQIIRINEKEGIVIRLHQTGKTFALPPDIATLQKAPRGQYRLQSTGEIINDPDYLTTWTIKPKASEDMPETDKP
jgi:hypothetical protein